MTLVDIYGNPLRSERELKQQQTHDDARLAHLQYHYDEHPTSGLTPSRLANIMREAENGALVSQMELAEDILEKDAHVYCEVDKRRKALLGMEWNIVPPRNPSAQEKADAELIQQMLEDSTLMDEAVLELADAIFKGFACLEIKWTQFDGLHLVQSLDFRPQTWFQLNPLQRDELRLRDNSHEGLALQPFGWVRHEHKAKSGYLGRAALVRQVAWPFLFKNLSVRDLGEFLEIYGLPLRLGKYPAGASENEKATLLRAVMSIGHNAGGIIPRGMELDFHEAAKGGADPFEAMIAWCERSQSKAIVGGTLTSQADGKSSTNALGNVHNEVRQELRDSDLKQIAATLTRDLVYPLYVLNGRSYRSPHRIPRLEFDITEPEDIKLLAESLPALVGLGMQIPQAWAHDKLKIPEAQKGQAVLSQAATKQMTSKPTALAALGAINKVTPVSAPERDQSDHFSAILREQMGDVLGGMTAGIRALVEQATSLEELAELLASHQVDVAKASAIMGQAFTAAELAGRLDVEQGN